MGAGGRNDGLGLDSKMLQKDRVVVEKFYRRFPALKLMPQIPTANYQFGKMTPSAGNPAQTYLSKYKKLVKQGYNETKAFEMVEADLNEMFESQRDDMRILRGGALAAHGDSYLDRAQAVAELESQLKMQRHVRDIPKFERARDASWVGEGAGETRDSIESILSSAGSAAKVDY